MTTKDEQLIKRLVKAVERISSAVNRGVFQMKDVDRAKVYSRHLGKRLRKK